MKFAGWTVLLCTLVFVLILRWPVAEANAGASKVGSRFSCRVTGVHDGDGPIYCAGGPKIRLTAVAARETDGSCSPGHPCPKASAEAATRALDKLTRGQVLNCEKTGTSYSRVTAWCWRSDGVEINCALVRGGTAAYWPKYDRARRMCGGRI